MELENEISIEEVRLDEGAFHPGEKYAAEVAQSGSVISTADIAYALQDWVHLNPILDIDAI